MKTEYGFGTTLQIPYEEAIPRVKEALKAEGFGVSKRIPVSSFACTVIVSAIVAPSLSSTYTSPCGTMYQ